VWEKNSEPGVFVFPLPAELEKRYIEWASSFQFNEKALLELQEKGYTPLFIPVFPGGAAPDCPAGSGGNPWDGGAQRQPLVNPYILFLILILLVLSFKKDQILAAVRRFLLKSNQKDPEENQTLK